jgi:hypothetical protein
MNSVDFIKWAVKAYIDSGNSDNLDHSAIFYDPTCQDWMIKKINFSDGELLATYQMVSPVETLFGSIDNFVEKAEDKGDMLLDCVFSWAKKVDKAYHPELYLSK